MAQELIRVNAARQLAKGHEFSPDSAWQQELEDSFPYMETPDQANAINEVKADMERTQPMDRLICGDVGYGKTEVALRAAFKTVSDGMQVGLLVPTTVLAQQHYATFTERLSPFPVRVEVLSRFRTHKEQQQVIEGLKGGEVDIVIGTHRLLQKDVQFKNLGLAVVDEEQRFGVSHKERFKQLRRQVDVLTLSATPIPRTLNMALSGLRDLSSMASAPEARLPVKTFVSEYSEDVVKEAILREMERGGQAFYLHNRVRTILQTADDIRKLIPTARVMVGHGQMAESELEDVMIDFANGEADVLVCTTIIESGLDMPNVNTLIVGEGRPLRAGPALPASGACGTGDNTGHTPTFWPHGDVASPRLPRCAFRPFSRRPSWARVSALPCATSRFVVPATSWGQTKAATSRRLALTYIRSCCTRRCGIWSEKKATRSLAARTPQRRSLPALSFLSMLAFLRTISGTYLPASRSTSGWLS